MNEGDDDQLTRAERALLDELFSARGRDDPHAVLAGSPLPGCRYAFVRAALHDRRLGPPRVPPSDDLLIQLLGRFLPRLPPQRHAAVRVRFSGLFTARRVGAYRERIAAASGTLIEAIFDGRHADLVADFARPLPFAVIADVLGVPASSQPWLSGAMDVIGRGFAGQRSRGPVELANAAVADTLSPDAPT